ncbi:MAG: trypsin-like peptidase domain-containing protein [Archangiaceae bacterium]|nr:trypsin-like peptidase domain-containing protein [Archangiaceae bacterium]
MRALALGVLWVGCAASGPALAPAPTREEARPHPPTLRERIAPVPTAKGDLRELYRQVAPATVLVRTKHGFGTGVIIDPRGFVLTNHHVIAGAESVDFKRKVTVELGALNAQGYMEKRPETYSAWVLKGDPAIDLAVLQLEAPLPPLTAVAIAQADPTPGEPVAALGHGAIGMLWAIRDGEVASIGKLATNMAKMLGTEREVAARRARLAADVPALVIQSSCQISPGDSGGPLVNRAGELVGVNAFLQSDPSAAVSTNFHVHVAEVRSFLREVPAKAAARPPDPHRLSRGAPEEQLDADRDGVRETHVFDLGSSAVVFSELGDGASVAVGTDSGHTLVWSGEQLVVEGRPGSGRGTAWRLLPGGEAEKQGENVLLLDRSRLSAAAARRFEAVEKGVLEPWGMPVNDTLEHVPDPYAATGWKLIDADGDLKNDAAYSGTTVVLDPAQALTEPIRQAPIAVVQRERRAWCIAGARSWATEDASSGAITTGDSRGHLLLEEALAPLSPDQRARARKALRRVLPALVLEGSPWPDPVRDVGTSVYADPSGVKGLEYAAVSVSGRGHDAALLFDLDPTTSGPGEMERRARKQAGFEMAWVRRSETEWFLYDTDHDGSFDVMLFLAPVGTAIAFRRQVDGAGHRAPELDGPDPVRPRLFDDAKHREAFAALARVFFNGDVVEP